MPTAPQLTLRRTGPRPALSNSVKQRQTKAAEENKGGMLVPALRAWARKLDPTSSSKCLQDTHP
jgi:hypothetical protein